MRLRRSRVRGWLKKFPRQRHIRGTWLHRMLGDRLFSPALWRPNRRTVALGAAGGLFWAMMPIPFQMLPSGLTAYLCRYNVPTAITVVWITNPFTWPVILYWQYRLGAWLLGQEAPEAVTMDAMIGLATDVPVALLLGCAITGMVLAAGSYLLVISLWDAVARRWWHSHARPRVQAAKAVPRA
ncbi:MAG: DUF2062 domain-containing protein [Chthoniobacterales bacterium]|nr:DUF2062 domain-containing protein [Chthoniobacterales bacterium]